MCSNKKKRNRTEQIRRIKIANTLIGLPNTSVKITNTLITGQAAKNNPKNEVISYCLMQSMEFQDYKLNENIIKLANFVFKKTAVVLDKKDYGQAAILARLNREIADGLKS